MIAFCCDFLIGMCQQGVAKVAYSNIYGLLRFGVIISQLSCMYPECLSPYTPMSSKTAIKKDFFIPTRKDDIRNFYSFYPKPIGRGGYGVVYQARLKQPPYSDRVVKVINKRFVKNPELLKNQITILKKLDHPHIVKLYESFEDESFLYLVEDLCEGGELFDRLDERGSFSEKEAREIFLEMLKTVKYLHLQKICHRDLKAENFLFYNKLHNTIALIDFGLAFQWNYDMREEMEYMGANKVVGTAYYVAPEVLSRDYDENCDVWSLGVLLHIITTATAPFPGDTDQQITARVKNGSYNENDHVVKLSPALRDLIRRILVPVQHRITLDDIFEHPWVKGDGVLHHELQLDFAKMKEFSSYSKLKAVFLAFIATQLPAKEIEQLGELFKQVDRDNDGYLSVKEIEETLHEQGINPSYNELHYILKSMDMDKNGKINYNEFIASCLSEDYCHRTDYLHYIFQYFDRDNSGTISRKDLEVEIEKMGLETPKRLVNQIMTETDLDMDGEISYQEFVNSIQKVN